jgi:hypothetical protein
MESTSKEGKNEANKPMESTSKEGKNEAKIPKPVEQRDEQH